MIKSIDEFVKSKIRNRTFRLGREDEEVVVSSLAMLEQGEVVALGRFEGEIIAATLQVS